MSEEHKQILPVLFGVMVAGLASTMVLFLILMVTVGLPKAADIVFGYSIGLFVFVLGIPWYSYLKKHLK